MSMENNKIFKKVFENRKNEPELRTQRMQLIVKPSTFEFLNEMVEQGVIKSKNDFINNFLEEFIAQSNDFLEK